MVNASIKNVRIIDAAIVANIIGSTHSLINLEGSGVYFSNPTNFIFLSKIREMKNKGGNNDANNNSEVFVLSNARAVLKP